MPSSSSSDAPRSPVPAAAASAAARSNNFPTSMSMSMDANDQQQQPPMAKKPRNSTTTNTTTTEDEEDRIQRAAMMMMKNPTYNVAEAMMNCNFTEWETKDRDLQQRVRIYHTKLLDSKGKILHTDDDSAPSPNDNSNNNIISKECISFAKKACNFFTKSTDPFLAVKNCSEQLLESGFMKLSKREPFAGKLVPGCSYFYTINNSTIVAFTVGAKFKPGNGFKIVGGHTDSPHLKVKPMSKRAGSGCVQLGVECYGGGLWHTWFDRDLGISGRVLVRTTDAHTQKEKIEQQFVQINRPVARVSTLCIHLQTAEERGSFKTNKEEHLSPILGTQTLLEASAGKQLNNTGGDDGDGWKKGQEPALMRLIASELDIDIKQIANFELGLFDCQPACLGGIQNEFLYSARLDNLATVFVALETIVEYSKSEDVATDDMISLVAFFDHEEIGSSSTHGAGSPVMAEAVSRITAALSGNPHSRDPDINASAVRKSFIFSCDQAHAVHPNYPSKHEKNHGPKMNGGVVLKTNQNQRYATNCVTGFLARELANKGTRVPLQEFVVRSDCPCGTTIGPILSATTGIRTVDVGMPQLSMHSCREVMGIADLTHGMHLFKSFFKHFNEVDDSLEG